MKIFFKILLPLLICGCEDRNPKTLSPTIYGFQQGLWAYQKEDNVTIFRDVNGVYAYAPDSKCTFPDKGEVPCVMSGFRFHYENFDVTTKMLCRLESDGKMQYGQSLRPSPTEPNVFFHEFSLPEEKGIFEIHQAQTIEDFRQDSSHLVTCFYEDKKLFEYRQVFKKYEP